MLADFLYRLRALFRRDTVERELDEELRFHFAQHVEKHVRSGVPQAEAVRRSRMEFGGIEQVKEECREARGTVLVETLAQDIRYGLRMMRRSPGFTAVAVLSLVLGIGANTAIFSFADAILRKQLPVPAPDRLVRFEWSTSYPFVRELERRNQVLAGLTARFLINPNLTIGDSTERISGELVTGNYFRVLGVGPALGRVLSERDDGVEGASPVCVISYDLWQEKFGGAEDVLNRRILLNARPFQIVGVTARGFDGSALEARTDLLVPTSMTSLFMGDKRDAGGINGWSWLQMIGRLKPGLTRAAAQANIDSVTQQIDKERGRKWKSEYDKLLPGDQGAGNLRRQFEKPVFVLLALVASVLLIACSNIANLLLARAVERRREIAVRLALGAGRARLIRQMLAESFVLSGFAGVCGFLLSFWIVRVLLHFFREGTIVIYAAPGLSALGFTAAVSILATFVFSLAPAFEATRVDVTPALKGSGLLRWTGRATLRRALLVGQMSVSLVMVFAAGLFGRTLRNLHTVDFGFKPAHVVLATINPTRSGYNEAATRAFYEQLLQRIRNRPGVEAAALANLPVVSGDMFAADVRVPGIAGDDKNDNLNWVSPDYFRTLQIPMLLGRDFNRWDRKGSQAVAIVNQQFVSHYFPGQNPLGKRFRWAGWKTDVEIVGMVKNTKYQTVREEPQRIYYLPTEQQFSEKLTLHVRTRQDASRMIAGIREIVRSIDPKLVVYNIQTLETQIDAQLFQERILASLSTFFSSVATLLAAIGLYGVVAYSVKRRFQEIGIRMALGARGMDVVFLFLRENIATVVAGIGIGTASAFACARYFASLLYGLPYNDAATLVATDLLLLLIGVLAAVLPARKATRLTPVSALHYE